MSYVKKKSWKKRKNSKLFVVIFFLLKISQHSPLLCFKTEQAENLFISCEEISCKKSYVEQNNNDKKF
jgi:cytochrome c-type biogenesis protein CcmE